MSRHLSFPGWEGCRRQARVRTTLGKSECPGPQGGLRPLARLRPVEDYAPEGRAYGSERNMSYGGTRNPLHIPKGCISVTLHLPRASRFYPDRGAGLNFLFLQSPRGSSGSIIALLDRRLDKNLNK